jgi:hypothetical protein
MKAPLIAAVAALSILTGGCVSKLAEGRVRSAWSMQGIDRANAACMAERMTDRLSIGQLRRLEALQAPSAAWPTMSGRCAAWTIRNWCR